MKRQYNLDYLRGLAAFGIMIYHYSTWTFGKFSADSFMGRLGVYGVSIFYVLSGLTLYYVYYHKMTASKSDIIIFLKKRIFRIFPLLWLVTIAAIIFSRKIPAFYDLFLNLTGLFGFIKWDTYFSVGTWSIGNELVFYTFLPFFIFFMKRSKALMFGLCLAIFGCYLYFAFVVLNPSLTLGEQWRNYVNPLNQVFLFLGGFLIGFYLQNRLIKNSLTIPLLVLAVALFTFLPAAGDTIHLVTGVNRIIFTSCCFLICICFYKLTFRFPPAIHKPLTLLGEASYSVYLLHPLVYTLLGFVIKHMDKSIMHIPDVVTLFVSVVCTLLISWLVYERFEKYFMNLGKRGKPVPV